MQENQERGEGARFPALQHLGRGIKLALPRLRHSIRHCIEVTPYFLETMQHHGSCTVAADGTHRKSVLAVVAVGMRFLLLIGSNVWSRSRSGPDSVPEV